MKNHWLKTWSSAVLALVLVLNGVAVAGLPPTTIKGQSDASAKAKFALQVPYSQFSDLGGVKAYVDTGNRNLLSNSSFEASTYSTGWTVTTATGAAETSTMVDGKQSAKLTFSSSTGDIAQSVTPSIQTASQSFEASCKVNTSLTTIQVCALSGGSEVNCVDVPGTGTWQYVPVNFSGPSNGTSVGVRVKASSSSTGTAYVDDCYVGPARNLSLVSQATLIGRVVYSEGSVGASGSNCVWSQLNASWSDYPTISSCPAPTSSGSIQGHAANVTPGFTISSASPGYYMIVVEETSTFNGGTGLIAQRLLEANTNTVIHTSGDASVKPTHEFGYTGYFNNTTTQSLDFKLQGYGDGTFSSYADARQFPITFTVYRFPTQSQQAMTVNTIPAFGGIKFSNFASQSTTSGSWVTVNNANYSGFSTYGNASGPSTSNDFGMQVSSVPAGTYRVYSNAHLGNNAASGGDCEMRIYDTTNSQEVAKVNTANQTSLSTGGNLDGFVTYSSFQSSVNFVIQYRSNAGITCTMNWANGSTIIPIIGFEPKTQQLPAPVFKNSIFTSSTSPMKIESAVMSVTGSGSCATVRQNGSWIGSTSPSGFDCTVNISAGTFSGAPVCTLTNNGGGNRFCVLTADPTSSSFTFESQVAGSASTGQCQVICMGPK